VVGGEGADVGCPVGREVVLDPVDALAAAVAVADRAHKPQRLGASATWAHPGPQVVGVDVERTEDVADAVAAVVGRAQPLGPPAPLVRVQRVKPPRVELVDDLADMRVVGQPHPRDLGHRHAHVGRQQDRRTDPRRLVLGARREPLQAHRLVVRQRPDEHLGGRIITSKTMTPPSSPSPTRFRPNLQRGPTSAMNVLPSWAHRNPAAAAAHRTVGMEEEVMLIYPSELDLPRFRGVRLLLSS